MHHPHCHVHRLHRADLLPLSDHCRHHLLRLHLLLLLHLLLSPVTITTAASAAVSATSLHYDFGTATAPSIPRARIDVHRVPPRIPGLFDTPSNTFLPASLFSTSISGTRLSIPLRPLSPDVYDVTVAFVQYYGCSTGHHVFDVLLNGVSKLDSFDIFTAAGNRCHRPVTLTFARQRLPGVLILSAVSTSTGSRASIAYMSVRRSADVWERKCERPVSKHGLPKHLAHAVPGTYKPETDWRGIGHFKIFLDGRQSHSHYTHTGERDRRHQRQRSAKLVSFTWTEMYSGRLISRKPALMHAFPVGVTYVTLMVVDDACNRHVASTSVIVTAAVKPGAYCYFYYLSSATVASGRMPAPQTIFSKTPQAPFAAAVASDAPMFDFDKMHPPLRSLPRFVARCVFFITVLRRRATGDGGDRTPVSVIVPGGKQQLTKQKLRARLFQGTRLAVDSASMSARGVRLSAGQTAFELHVLAYGGTGGPRRRVSVFVNRQAPKTSYDETSVMPVLTSVSPSRASLSGGNVISVSGYGLYWPLSVYFGNVKAVTEWRGSTSTRLFIKTPRVVKSASVLPLSVQSKPDIVSNKLRFNFSDACDSIAFARKQLLPRPTQLKLVTAAVHGNDNRLYLASLTGKVFRMTVDVLSLSVRQTCESPVLYDKRYRTNNGAMAQRAALGITLDPRDSPPRPYVSLNTLEWPHRITTDNKLRWANGAVDRLVNADALPGATAARMNQKKKGSYCLAFDKHIVTNLPVSRRDHGVNALLFTQSGDLLISLGGHTNAGLPSHAMGGSWETYFSSAVIIARLSRGAKFNGAIQYVSNPSSPARARPRSTGDIDLFATGTRNLFSMTMLRDGRILGVDMGANCGQGNVSSSCTQYSSRDNREEISKMNGRVVVDASDPDAKTCPYGPSRVDKILHVKQNGFYGHPNLQRGRPDECRWVDPISNHLPPRYAEKPPPSRYVKPFALVFSAKTGLVQYGANLFCGELRGDVLLSQYSETGTWRLRLGGKRGSSGGVGPLDDPYQFINGYSGMAILESIHGDLIMPRFKSAGVYVAKARTRLETERQKARSLTVINALPFRHGSRGGTVVYVGGFGFKKSGMRVYVGKRGCRVLRSSAREITCVVPPRSGGPLQADVTVIVGKMKSVLPKAVLYMRV